MRKYTVFGKVLKGMDVVDRIQLSDVLKKAYLKRVRRQLPDDALQVRVALEELGGYSPGSSCPRSCFRIAALATDFAEKWLFV